VSNKPAKGAGNEEFAGFRHAGYLIDHTRAIRVDQTFDTLHGGIQRILHFLRLSQVCYSLA